MNTVTAPAITGTYAIDPTHSRIGFAARHAMVTKVRGSFNQFEGAGFFDAETPANSRLEVTIQSASIDTRNADRDAHLRSNDFFDMESYPTIRFSSTEVASGGSAYRVTGDLTIKGVTKPVTLAVASLNCAPHPFTKKEMCGANANTKIKRSDFNAGKNAPAVSDEVTLNIVVEAIKE